MVDQRTSPRLRVFGVLSTDGTAAGLVPLTTGLGSWNAESCGGEHLWMVGCTVRERQLWAPAAVGPEALAGLEPSARSGMRLRITAILTGGTTVYEIDVGQSLELYVAGLQLPQGRVGAERQWHAYHLAGHRLIDPTDRMRRI